MFPRNIQPICAVFELETRLALSDGARRLGSFISIQLRPVRHDEKPSQENVTDLKSCKLGKFLVVPTFIARRLYVRLNARAPSGESWNYLSRMLYCNIEEDLTPSTPYRDLIFATNLCQGSDGHN